jgi:hypothetical protein
MVARLPVLFSLLGAAILFAAIALVFTLVIMSLVVGGLDLPGEPEIADAAALVLTA